MTNIEHVRIFISSVKRELEDERRSLAGLITQLGHTPLMFEDFSAQDMPSREACLRGANDADAYLLLLGPRYGAALPETGQSPTHEEWSVARNRGIPRLVYRKLGVDFEDAQQNFYREIAQYSSGVFHDDFRDVPELLIKISGRIRELEQSSGPLSYKSIDGAAPQVTWRSDFPTARRYSSSPSGAILELHILPSDMIPPTRRELRSLGESLVNRIRQARLVGDSEPLSCRQEEGAFEVDFPDTSRPDHMSPTPGRTLGLRLDPSGQISIWGRLPSNGIGSLFDPDNIVTQISGLLRAVGALNLVTGEFVALGVAIEPIDMVTIGIFGQAGNSATFNLHGRDRLARIEPDELISVAAMTTGATDAAQDLGAKLHDSLRA